ncbi:MAG: hypothetical protein BTN85_0207 [Candidatus Methanohalarchaeum thermophilum]|uniref:Uncharacterized protein n=1 Tax=Methanohalarchaeum thermophilum TaxID=1903181 RepID=A0A1Q6DTT1_METT1|nr:MAG: hypothetical protein BTN85_0207 [Candidatus Methanohalarchaeum thermophilum]
MKLNLFSHLVNGIRSKKDVSLENKELEEAIDGAIERAKEELKEEIKEEKVRKIVRDVKRESRSSTTRRSVLKGTGAGAAAILAGFLGINRASANTLIDGGSISDGGPNGADGIPIDLQDVGEIGSYTNPAEALYTEQISHEPPLGQYSWEVLYPLYQGAVIAPDGQVFQGKSAAQDAIDYCLTSNVFGTLRLGVNEYDPVTIEPDNIGPQPLKVIGVGNKTKILSSTNKHALTIKAPTDTDFTEQLTFRDFQVRGDNEANNPVDLIHIKNENDNKIAKINFFNIFLNKSNRDAIHLEGKNSGNNIRKVYFRGCGGNSIGRYLVYANQDVNTLGLFGLFGVVDSDTAVHWGGRNSVIVTAELVSSSNRGVVFSSSSRRNILITSTDSEIIDNGSENTVISYYDIHGPGSPIKKSGVLDPITLHSNETIQGRGRATLYDGETSDHAISIDGNNITVKNVAVQTTAGEGNNYDGINWVPSKTQRNGILDGVYIRASDRDGIRIGPEVIGGTVANCQFDSPNIDEDAIYCNGSRITIIGNAISEGSGTIRLGPNSSNCVVLGNTGVYITDNGSENITKDNTS